MQGDNDQATFYVEVQDTEAIKAALDRLYDGAFLEMPKREVWRWHVTCMRDSRGRDRAAIWNAARELESNQSWAINCVADLELRGARYEEIAVWRI
jgi:hypothetical protein